MSTVYDFKCMTITGEEHPLSDFSGHVILIVNTASKCGLTPQFEGLEHLYTDYKDQGLVILGFPCNQFANQDPASNSDISEFCSLNYGVSFPMFAKIEVNGNNTDPLFKHLKEQAPGIMGSQKIKWNFTKFLVDRNGKVVRRFAPATKPEDIESAIKELI